MPNDTYKIKPAGRHILTIGRDLVQDYYAAILELVKNSYDADSPDVQISLKFDSDEEKSVITITDHGHGMTRDTVINKWMVPSTKDKLERLHTPNGRTMQGRKGVGRYAASVLGNDLLLTTITPEGEKTTVYLDWKEFEKAEYLQDVEILIETQKSINEKQGTELIITGGSKFSKVWDKNQIKKLRTELKKLKSPVGTVVRNKNTPDSFKIELTIEGHEEKQNKICEVVEPFPIFDLFDYKISGTVNADGQVDLTYSNQKTKNIPDEKINKLFKESTCGDLTFDIRVYDREVDAIQGLINRGLSNPSGEPLKKQEARVLLNEHNGIGVYRSGFRIRPLGDAGFDWLNLDKRRVQNPSMRVGGDQVIGYVQIQSEEESELIEKSARDGLKENNAFASLKEISQKVILELETRRALYRSRTRLGRQRTKIEQEISRLISFDDLKQSIQKELVKSNVQSETIQNTVAIINKEEKSKTDAFENIRRAVAIYQGQATLGKIINVILHEGRQPLGYFKNQIPNLQSWCNKFEQTKSNEYLHKMLSAVEGVGENAEILVKLFSRLDPLGATKRSSKKSIKLKNEIEKSFQIFANEMIENSITYQVNVPSDVKYDFWQQDLYAIFANLIDNSIYWIKESSSDKRTIIVDLKTDQGLLISLDYRDTGPGIAPDHIASEVIFEPEFSTKPNGTGLGLAIAGEAATRNGFELKVIESEQGAYFQLNLINGENQ